MKEYKRGTFDRHVAYGQRQRKLMLVSKGIIDAFKVRCQSTREAENLARAFRIRSSKVQRDENARYSLRVKVEGKTIHVTRKGLVRQ
ncbi:hypothetical protein [[Eubacterium] cellulosolvens]